MKSTIEFNIYSQEEKNILPVDIIVVRYIENLIREKLIQQNKIFDSKWTYVLNVTLRNREVNSLVRIPDGIHASPDKKILVFPYTSLSGESLRVATVIANIANLINASQVPLLFAHLLIDITKEFCLKNFKRINPEEVAVLKTYIDEKYVNSFPYPSPHSMIREM